MLCHSVCTKGRASPIFYWPSRRPASSRHNVWDWESFAGSDSIKGYNKNKAPIYIISKKQRKGVWKRLRDRLASEDSSTSTIEIPMIMQHIFTICISMSTMENTWRVTTWRFYCEMPFQLRDLVAPDVRHSIIPDTIADIIPDMWTFQWQTQGTMLSVWHRFRNKNPQVKLI